MKISTKGIYALEMVVDLAIYADDGNRASIRSVAVRRKLSEKYLERIASMGYYSAGGAAGSRGKPGSGRMPDPGYGLWYRLW